MNLGNFLRRAVSSFGIKNCNTIKVQRPRSRRRLGRAVQTWFEQMEGRQMLSAVVVTDQLDYAPGSTALITTSNDLSAGNNFQQGETVEFQVTRTDGIQDFPNGNLPWRVTDGGEGDLDGKADGSIQTSWFVEQQ